MFVDVPFSYYNISFIPEKAHKFQLCIAWLAKGKIKNTFWFHVLFKLSLRVKHKSCCLFISYEYGDFQRYLNHQNQLKY